ncbi:MAG: enoyl-CoA hydratase/isomerase family protein, partial [Pseudomonadota bacterium]|nr:enoyl-CoA hydratase/isomerase family protein [Pseudomonadota bacterium]
MSNALLTSRQGAVMTVTMNRPDQLNILGEPGDGDAFRKVFDAINEDRSIKCVIFTGAGRAFSAGGNVK